MSTKPISFKITGEPGSPEYDAQIDAALAAARANQPEAYQQAINRLAYALLGPGWHIDPVLVADVPFPCFQDSTESEF